MKTLALALILLAPLCARAATAELTTGESLKIVEAMLLSGVKADKSQPVYTLGVKDLSCEAANASHGGSPDDIFWGLNRYSCDNPAVKGAKAKLLWDTLDDVQTRVGGENISITDCAMGRCYVMVSVSCRIDSDKTASDERFHCTVKDQY